MYVSTFGAVIPQCYKNGQGKSTPGGKSNKNQICIIFLIAVFQTIAKRHKTVLIVLFSEY